ncbi:DUF1906 domain-containing protein [Thermomonospora umbrina]|uniref:Uncharacterized protein DUF1906 n=1 Tax=Thermomonospora umbrina TaxID=111806 RepID=A0A3D9SHC7_9ACTN|nr:DUF1906 domain-containing protein [Thermomonospora umbrina]REE95306.1 uncharacterized protein DUF1906 [Thermomonospora umbrina]
MSVFGIDYAWGRPGVAALKRAGAKFVCRYVSHDTTGKNLTRKEADELSAAGLWLVVVWETTARRALSGRSGGAADAEDADRMARACGMPPERPIYFAVDFDASSAQQDRINAYLDGAAGVIGRERVGLYGGYGPVKRCLDAGKATWAWQTYAWSKGRWDRRAHIQQYSNSHELNGVSVDYNRAVKGDYGQWRVGETPSEDDMPDYVSVGAAAGQALPGGAWTTLAWDIEYSDTTGQHADGGGPALLSGPARYALTVSVTLRDLPAGARVQARAIEVSADDAARFAAGPVQQYIGAGTDVTSLLYGLPADTIDGKRRLHFQIHHDATGQATVTAATAKLLYWRD